MKKIILWLLICMLGVVATANAEIFGTITVSTTAVSLGSDVLQGYDPNVCLITIEGGNIRMRLDGTSPTTLIGHVITTSNSPFKLENRREVQGFRAIRDDGADVTLSYTCW